MSVATYPSTGAVTGLRETLDFFSDPCFASKRFAAHGNVFETRLLAQRIVFIRGERAVSDLLKQGAALEGWWPDSVRKLLGSRSLANRTGPAHRARRRVVGQLFSSGALCRYTPSIQVLIEELITELQESDAPQPLAAKMRRFAFAVIATTVLGLNASDRDALFADFEIWTQALFSIPLAIPGTPFAQALAARERLLARLKTVLQHSDSSQGGLDLLSGGIDEIDMPLDDDDLVEQLLLPELLASPWPFEASHRSPRLDATVLEVMRLTPPVGGFFRRNLQPIRLADVEVPKDRVIQVVLGSVNAEQASDIAAFRPQRHLDGSFNQTLLPFGGGERVCLGKALAELEIRLMTVGLIQKLQLRLVPGQDLSLKQIPSPTPRDGLLVSVEPR